MHAQVISIALNIPVRLENKILNTQILNALRRHLTQTVLHNSILQAVSHEERSVLIGEVLGNVVLDAVAQEQVAGHAKDTTQLLLAGQTREQRHSTTL